MHMGKTLHKQRCLPFHYHHHHYQLPHHGCCGSLQEIDHFHQRISSLTPLNSHCCFFSCLNLFCFSFVFHLKLLPIPFVFHLKLLPIPFVFHIKLFPHPFSTLSDFLSFPPFFCLEGFFKMEVVSLSLISTPVTYPHATHCRDIISVIWY